MQHLTKQSRVSRGLGVLALLTALALGCGGEQAGSGQGASSGAPAAGTPTPSASGPEAPAPGSPIDESLAARGEQAFQARACVGCHKIGGGRLTGPDLQGVTERRSYQWIMAMITNPDSMLKVDQTARQLLAEYGTPMANMGVPADEARALYEYLRQQSSQ